MGIDPDDDDQPIKAVKDAEPAASDRRGRLGPITAVCHGWNESSRAVHGTIRSLTIARRNGISEARRH